MTDTKRVRFNGDHRTCFYGSACCNKPATHGVLIDTKRESITTRCLEHALEQSKKTGRSCFSAAKRSTPR